MVSGGASSSRRGAYSSSPVVTGSLRSTDSFTPPTTWPSVMVLAPTRRTMPLATDRASAGMGVVTDTGFADRASNVTVVSPATVSSGAAAAVSSVVTAPGSSRVAMLDQTRYRPGRTSTVATPPVSGGVAYDEPSSAHTLSAVPV